MIDEELDRIDEALDEACESWFDDENLTFGERVADKVAAFGGSWTFIGLFALVLVGWISFNVLALTKRLHFDPYPFILLNLILSTIAALQAPIIMMSQNRQESRDRERAMLDFQLSRKAEREIIRALKAEVKQLRRDHVAIYKLLIEVRNACEKERDADVVYNDAGTAS